MSIHGPWTYVCRVMMSVAVLAVAGCAGYVPGRQAYWDAQVDRMCETDGGMRVFEVMELTPHQYGLLLNSFGKIDIPIDAGDLGDVPVIRREETTVIRDANPRVWRYALTVVRKADRRILGVQVTYSRVGGDFPSPAHESSYSCPKHLESLFAATVKQRGEWK